MKNGNVIAKIHTDKNEKVHIEPFYFFKWILKVECIILIIFFIMGLLFNSISEESKFAMKYNVEKFFYSNIQNESYSYKDIVQAIDVNPHIQNQDKQFISNSLKKEIEENIKYIDMNELIKKFETLKVSYLKKYKYNKKAGEYELLNPKITSMNIMGNYSTLMNKINLYEGKERNIFSKDYEKEVFDISLVNKEVYFHELNHVMTKKTLSTRMNSLAQSIESKEMDKTDKNFFGNIANSIQVINKNTFSEMINELFTREYFDEYLQENEQKEPYKSYEEYMVYAYALAEILPEETLRAYKFNDNESILISGLLEIDNNMEEVYKLISSINSVILSEDKLDDNNKQYYKKIHDGYAYFYEKKYNKKMSEDMELLLYFYWTPIQTNEEENRVRAFLGMKSYDEILNIIPKGYVSESYKNKHKGVQVEYTKNGKQEFIEINNM